MKIKTFYANSFYGNKKESNIKNNFKKNNDNEAINKDIKDKHQKKSNNYLESKEPDVSKKAMDDALMILFLKHNKMI